MPSRKRLSVELPRAWDTAAAALTACARALGDGRAVPEIAAASGLAFRVVSDDRISLGGPHAWPWSEELSAAAARLGFLPEVVWSGEPPESPLHAAARARALALVSAQLDAARPTMIWGVHAPEFGLVRGRDGARLLVSGILDGMAPDALDESELGEGAVPVVFALALVARLELSAEEAARSTLRAALELGAGPTAVRAGYAAGLPAWDQMARALESGVIDPGGLAYAAQRYAEARAAVAFWLDGPAGAAGLDLARVRAAFRKSAGMLAELARLHPFPAPPGTMLTDPEREQSRELVLAARRAEAEGLAAIADALGAHERARADRIEIVDATPERLFACTRELPVVLDDEAAACRARPPRGKLALERGRVVGQLLWAPLEQSLYPIAAEGKRLVLYCPWVAHDRRGRGLGGRLFAALDEEAQRAGADGLLTLATGDERFLAAGPFERAGWTEVDRIGDTRLLERRLNDAPSRARLVAPPGSPPASAAAAERKLAVVIRHGHNCPLLLHTRGALARAAQATPGASLDERDATATDPAGASINGRPLLHGYVPEQILAGALREGAKG